MLDNKLFKQNISQNKSLENIIDHSECISQLENMYKIIVNKENENKCEYNKLENKFIDICNNEDDLIKINKRINKENEILKFKIKEMEKYKENNTIPISYEDDIIYDKLLYIDFDVFKESEYILQKRVNYYEFKLNCVNDFLYEHNISSFGELSQIVTYYKNSNINKVNKKLENVNIKIQSQKLKTINLTNKYKYLDIRIKEIKNKINKLPIGTVIKINGVKKIFKGKTEKLIDKIKTMEEEYNNYIKSQILWARKIVDKDINDDKLIKILDLYNKLTNNKNILCSSESETEKNNKYYNILNENKNIKILEFETYSKLGNQFIDDKINSKKDLSKDNLIFIKEIIKTSDIKSGSKDDKINRFINTCKRCYILSQKLSDKNNIIKNKCKTDIRDINNSDFYNLIKLLENNNNS